MPAQNESAPPNRGASFIELCVAFFALIAIAMFQIAATGTIRLLSHPLWLDECLTAVVASDPSFSHEMNAIARGVNYTPPTYFLMLRSLRLVLGNLGAIELRTLSALASILAALGLYATCRRFFDRTASMIASLALWAHPLLVSQVFESRFYAVWMAATSWLCFLLLRDSARRSNWNVLVAGLLSVIVATIQWLGIATIGLIWLADMIAHRSIGVRALLRRSIPAIAGGVSLLCCLPFLMRQRASVRVPIWIDPISVSQIQVVATELYCTVPISAALLCAWLWRIGNNARDTTKSPHLKWLAPLSSLLLLPVILLVISYTFQPVLISRYAIVTVLPLSMIVGWLASRMTGCRGRAIRITLIVVLFVNGCMQFSLRAQSTDADDARFANCIKEVESVIAHHGPLPVVFLRRHDMYPVIQLRPDLAPFVALLNFDDPRNHGLSRVGIFEQQMARVDNSVYPQFAQIKYSQLQAARHFMLVVPPDAGADLRVLLPGAEIRPLANDLFEILFR